VSARLGWAGLAFLAALVCAPATRAQGADLFIEAELEPSRVYVGEAARLRLRLYRATGVGHGTMRLPEIGDAADVHLLGPIRVYETERAGATYEVLERSHVIVARRAGQLIVPGAVFEGAQRYAEVFAQGRGGALGEQAARMARGPDRVLEVRAPPDGAATHWLPARHLTLEQAWSRDPDALTVGAAVTRTLVLRADGLAAERLPELQMPAHPALVVHHDHPELVTEYRAEGVRGRRVQRIVLMPLAAADVALAPITVSWWDVGADTARAATLAGRTLRLHPAVAEPGTASRPVEPESGVPWLLRLALAAGAVSIATLVWWRRRTHAPRAARERLRAACRSNDAQAARDALRDWAAAAAPDASPLVRRIGAAWPDAAARAQLDALDEALYAGRAWDGAAFWRAVAPRLRGEGSSRPRARGPLRPPPLFRLQAAQRVRTREG